MKTKRIEIDTETNSLIEANRNDFSESENEIIKRSLKVMIQNGNIADLASPLAVGTLRRPINTPSKRPRRSSGTYAYRLFGETHSENSLKAAYISCLRRLQANDSSFFGELAQEETRARRIVATEPTNLYKNSPELAMQHAERIDGNWFVDTNLSEPQVIQRLKIAAQVAGLDFGSDLNVDFA